MASGRAVSKTPGYTPDEAEGMKDVSRWMLGHDCILLITLGVGGIGGDDSGRRSFTRLNLAEGNYQQTKFISTGSPGYHTKGG